MTMLSWASWASTEMHPRASDSMHVTLGGAQSTEHWALSTERDSWREPERERPQHCQHSWLHGFSCSLVVLEWSLQCAAAVVDGRETQRLPLPMLLPLCRCRWLWNTVTVYCIPDCLLLRICNWAFGKLIQFMLILWQITNEKRRRLLLLPLGLPLPLPQAAAAAAALWPTPETTSAKQTASCPVQLKWHEK